ncbi:MAG: hypothetical protein K6E28_04840 [Eubacterium sp.]|nr:hypothetical protein [Eubacterium sp.]
MKNIFRVLAGILIFVGIFAATAFTANLIYNRGRDMSTAEMTDAKLPEICFMYRDYRVNRIPAYLGKLDVSLMHDAIISVDKEEKVTALIEKDNKYAEQVLYELRDVSEGNLIEDGEMTVGESGATDDSEPYSVSFRMNLTVGKEYSLVIKLVSEGHDTLNYYTKVVRLDRDYTKLFINYAYSFNNCTFLHEGEFEGTEDGVSEGETLVYVAGKDEPEEPEQQYIISTATDADALPIVTPVEEFDENNVVKPGTLYSLFGTNTKNAAYDLGTVNMDSTYDEVCWGVLNPTRVTEVVPVLRELSDTSAFVENDYIMKSTKSDSETYYKVRECYRLNYSDSTGRPVLGDYQRTAEEIYDGTGVKLDQSSLNLGLNHLDYVDIISTDDFKMNAFTTCGSVWVYDYKAAEAVQAFTNLSKADISNLSMDGRYGIKLLSIDEEGTTYFAVYGRINRGKHEGRNGIVLYKYDDGDYSITEQCFIETEEPYDVLRAEAAKFMYFDTEKRFFYTWISDSYVCFNIDKKRVIQVIPDLNISDMHAAQCGYVLAYPDTDVPEDVQKITISNLATDREYELEKKGRKLCILGFLGDDLVYGAAMPSSVGLYPDGRLRAEYSGIYIVGPDGEEKQSYEKSGIVVTGYSFTDGGIILKRKGRDEEGSKVPIDDDRISFNRSMSPVSINKTLVFSKTRYSELCLMMPQGIYLGRAPKSMVAGTRELNKSSFKIDAQRLGYDYYVYTIDGLSYMTGGAGDAINYTKEHEGVVVARDGTAIYRRSKPIQYYTVAGKFSYFDGSGKDGSYVACLKMGLAAAGYNLIENQEELNGSTDWEEEFRLVSNGTVYGIAAYGINTETGLEYLSNGSPFAVRFGDHYVMVVSFNQRYIRYYDPTKKEEVKVGRKTFAKEVEESGNEIYTFIK